MTTADPGEDVPPLGDPVTDAARAIEAPGSSLREDEVGSRLAGLAEGLADLGRRLGRLQARSESQDVPARWTELNRRIDELFGVLEAIKARDAAPAARGAASDRGIFVIGHARSGTTFLTDALNTSDDIYCLMEPYFYRSIEVRPFADTFNAMHRGFGNPPIKGYWVPACNDGSGRDILGTLRTTYRYVGEKLAFRQRRYDYDPDRFLGYAVEEFARSPFICIIRDPVRVTSSVIDMFEQGDFSSDTIAEVVRSQLETLLLIMRIALTVPHCYVLEYEAIGARLFASLGGTLGVDLGRAMALHVAGCQRTPQRPDVAQRLRADPNVAALQQVDAGLRALLDRERLGVGADHYGKCRELCEFVIGLLNSMPASVHAGDPVPRA